MDNHFGKQKFKSGNIPFTMFGPFDQKMNVLFKDSTDSLKTKYELSKISNFERSLESFYDERLRDDRPYCSNAYSSMGSSTLVVLASVLSMSLSEMF